MSEYLEDLKNESSESFEDGNYFIVTIDDLNPNTTYFLQFRWKYKDGTFAKTWSAVKLYTTPGESSPNTPSFLTSDVDVSEPEKLIITYRGLSDDATPVPITDIDRVDVYISGAPFDGTKPAHSFKEAATQIIPAPAGTYIIVLYAISKLGTKSPVSSPVTKTVTAATTPIDPPTLPSGLSVASAPFAVSVNWSGSYSSGGFDGFKSIDIHVRGSDVGVTATSGFSTTTQIATLTVDSTTNRQNIGLDNLRQALSLASNEAAYTAPMFFYYIARNQNDELYSVGGTPTYTRINSSSINPTQANLVDLANGLISIQNLVAGNGEFSSWLRVGSNGGSRIELSGANTTTPSGSTYPVKKGLVAYNSGNTEIFNLDVDAQTLSINGSGTFTGNLAIGSGNNVFKAEPTKAIWLGSSTWNNSGDAPFSVAVNGSMYAINGTIGGWTLGQDYLQGNNIKLQTGQILIGSTSQPYFDISPTALTHRNANGSASGKFTLTLGNSSQLTLDGTLTINGSSIATDAELSTGLATKIGAADVNSNVTSISGGVITTGTINLNNVNVNTGTGNNSIRLSSAGLELYNNVGTRTVHLNPSNGDASFTGTITGSTITGGLIRTGSSGSRIQIAGSDQGTNPNAITFINPGGSPSAHIVPLNIGGTTYGLLMHEGGTADQTGGTYPQLFVGNGGVTMSARQFLGGPQGLVSVSNSGVFISGTNGADVNVTGPITFSATMFAPNLSTSTSGTNLRVTTGTVGEIQETSASSVRYKENIQNLILSSELNPNNLLNLPVRSFTYKDGYVSDSDDRYNKVLPGFIAEEVEEHYPIAVDYAEGQPHTWNERFIVPGILALVQNLNQELINIKSRLDALGG